MLESSCLCIELKCGWDGKSKQDKIKDNIDQSKLEEELILLSGPYGDDVAFVKEFSNSILIGLSDGVSGNRHLGVDPYRFAHELIVSCIKEADVIRCSSSMRGLVHRAIRHVERHCVFGSGTLCLLSIDKINSNLRSLNIGDSGFMLIRNNKLLKRSNPQYHRGSSPFQLSSIPTTNFFSSNSTRLYHDKPSDGEYFEQDLQIGDLLLVASDGLFDNLYEDFIIQILNQNLDQELSVESLENVCQSLVQAALHARIKRDDILVLLFSVVRSSSPSSSLSSIDKITKANECASNSSLSSLSIDQDEEDSLDLFIFNN